MPLNEPFNCSQCDCPDFRCSPVAAHDGEDRSERRFGVIFQCEQCGHKMIAYYRGLLQTFHDYEHPAGLGPDIH